MGKKTKNSGEGTKKVKEEEKGTVCLFCYLVEGMNGNVSKDLWMVMSNSTMDKVKDHQSRWFSGEEDRTIIVDKGVSYDGDKRSFTENEFNKEFSIAN